MKWNVTAKIEILEPNFNLNIEPNPISLSYTLEDKITDEEVLKEKLKEKSQVSPTVGTGGDIMLQVDLYGFSYQEINLEHDTSASQRAGFEDGQDLKDYILDECSAITTFSVVIDEDSSEE